ncbi:helix-turn-helix transcriptional regulator [Rhodococcus sp. NPDC058481]|uniref:helix-turn-helix transcriptional regulator n=1 Tax=unclassified Rhodococcus (in: high G+C Gram-positive bacteria) TaxID=192944 RepID=UPI003662F9B1
MSRRILRGFNPAALEQARKERRLSRAELGRLAEVSTTAVLYWETGRSVPQVDTLTRVVRVLEIPVEQVVNIEPNERYLGDLRVVAGLTQPQLAASIGISTTSLATLERGQSRLKETVATRLAKALDTSVQDVTDAYERTRTRPPHTSP